MAVSEKGTAGPKLFRCQGSTTRTLSILASTAACFSTGLGCDRWQAASPSVLAESHDFEKSGSVVSLVKDYRFPFGQEAAYTQISLTSGILCALDHAGTIDCLDLHERKVLPSVEGPWRSVSTGIGHVCADSASGRIGCWGGRFDEPGHFDPATRNWTAFASTEGGVCGLTPAGNVECSPGAARYERSGLELTSLVERNGVPCGDGPLKGMMCWGEKLTSESWEYPDAVVDAHIVDLAFGRWGGRHCILTEFGKVHCLGVPRVPEGEKGMVPPTEPLSAIAMNSSYGYCGIDVNGIVRCSTGWKHAVWGVPKDDTRFRAIEAGTDIYCGLTIRGVVRCWGLVM